MKINNGEKKWLSLKDRKCVLPVKGIVEIEATLIYTNVKDRFVQWDLTSDVFQVKAIIRTFNPRQVRYYQQDGKFRVGVSVRRATDVSLMESVSLGVQAAYQSSEKHAGRRGESIQIYQLLFSMGKSTVELLRFHRRRTLGRCLMSDEPLRSVDIPVGRLELRIVHGALCTAVSVRTICTDRVSSRSIGNALFHAGRRSKFCPMLHQSERVGFSIDIVCGRATDEHGG